MPRKSRKVPTVTLPREVSPEKVGSDYRKAIVRMSDARKVWTEAKSNVGAIGRRRDRTLAAWSLSRKLYFVRTYHRTDIHGAAKVSAIRKAARAYRRANLAWKGYYFGSHTLGTKVDAARAGI